MRGGQNADRSRLHFGSPGGTQHHQPQRNQRVAIFCLSFRQAFFVCLAGNDSNLLIVFYVQIMPDDFVMQLHRF
ncbi:hypothetical protein B6I39_24115 [Klebsiella quasipneumoniae]|nr:hypothetical protein B6I39_24115 [Klebsiella quasipneumoniae]